MTIRSVISGVGGYLPERVVTNKDLERKLETDDAWIQRRTGIRQRHIAAESETTSSMGVRAAQAALEAAGIEASSIDGVICATTTADHTFPATACAIQAELGIGPCPAFDVQAVCTGFIYALAQGHNMIQQGRAERLLLVGAETYSRLLDWSDRSTCVLFGDGAGACVLSAQRGTDRGVLAVSLKADGRYYRQLYVNGGVSSTKTVGVLCMDGKEIYRHAVQKMASSLTEALGECAMTPENMDWFVPHQANLRIIQSVGQQLAVDPRRVVVTVQEHANTSAAAIPLALSRHHRRFREGDIVGLTALGGGLTWGSVVVRW